MVFELTNVLMEGVGGKPVINLWQILNCIYWIQPSNLLEVIEKDENVKLNKSNQKGINSPQCRPQMKSNGTYLQQLHIRKMYFIVCCEPPALLAYIEFPHLIYHVYEWQHPGVKSTPWIGKRMTIVFCFF